MREDEFVAAIAAVVARPHAGRVRIGIGDDAAVWQPSRSHRSVISTDTLVEGVHFRTDWMSWRDVGVRAMAANLSDLAAMGAKPVLATVGLGIPNEYRLEDALELYRGLVAVTDDAKMAIVGGDISRSPVWMVAITVVGEVRQTRLKLRSGAKAGDVIASTGQFGTSRAGLDILRGTATIENADLRDSALRAYRTPVARWREGIWLGASSNVHALMDCSDGLAIDLNRIADRSCVGALIESVPVSAEATAAASGQSADDYALAAGEDFELLAAIAPRAFGYLATRFEKRFRRPLFPIGVFTQKRGIARLTNGIEKAVEPRGWDHLSNAT